MNRLMALILAVFLAPILTGCNEYKLTPVGKGVAERMQETYGMSLKEAEKLVGIGAKTKNADHVLTILYHSLKTTKGNPEWRRGKYYGVLAIHEDIVEKHNNECGIKSVEDLYDVEKSFCIADKVFTNINDNIDAGRITDEQKKQVEDWGKEYIMLGAFCNIYNENSSNFFDLLALSVVYRSIKNLPPLIKE